MSAMTGMLLGFVGAYLGVRLLLGLVILVQVLRVQIHPARVRRMEEAPALTADQTVAVAEVQALGFEPAGTALVESGPARYFLLLFRHATLPCFATLTMLPATNQGYPVTFFSFATDGKLLLTGNRVGLGVFASPPEVLRDDPYADSLAAHWQAHQARAAQVTAAAVSDEEALRRIGTLTEEYLPLLRARGLCVEEQGNWHPGLRAALVTTWNWQRKARKLARRYVSPVTSGDSQVAYFTHCYTSQEALVADRPARRKLKLTVLLLSIVVALALWGLMFKWAMAVMLVGIVLFHESGHALAMRLYGYRDMSMFFIPFVGAIVTGKPKDLPAWKQAVMLFAGPLPGLLIGLAILFYGAHHALPQWGFNWRALAGLAIAVNFFNLLPISPLDGGQLMEVCLFNRWPLSRLVFSLLGICAIVGLAFWLHSPSMTFVAVALVLGIRSHFRIMRLQRAWREGLDREAQIHNLFETAKSSFKVQIYATQAALVKAVLVRRTVRRARPWESAAILSVLLVLWGAAGVAATRLHHPHGAQPPNTTAEPARGRSPAQLAFDQAYEDETEDAPSIAPMMKWARQLSPDDPRHVDMAYQRALLAEGEDRRTQVEALLTAGRSGHFNTVGDMEEAWLGEAYTNAAQSPPAERAATLSAAVDRMMRLVPSGFAATVDTRLRMAEAIDQAGDAAKAETMLLDLRQRAATADHCRCALERVVEAQVWFDLSRHRGAEAVALIESSPLAAESKEYGMGLSLDYAWALLDAGRLDQGVQQMHTATVLDKKKSASWPPTQGTPAAGVDTGRPLDMAYAWHLAGRDVEIQSLNAGELQSACQAILHGLPSAGTIKPWAQLREATLLDFAKSGCPKGTQAVAGTAQ